MRSATHSLTISSSGTTSSSGGSVSSGHRHAAAFSGGSPLAVDLQAQVRCREDKERSSIVSSGVPQARVRQVLSTVLALPAFTEVPLEALRVDVHRGDGGKYRHDYGLALAVALVSSLARKRIPAECLFLGDVDLQGQVVEVAAKLIDRLNDAVNAFEIETPLTVVCAPGSGTWVNASSTVKVLAARSLAEVTALVWPGVTLRAW